MGGGGHAAHHGEAGPCVVGLTTSAGTTRREPSAASARGERHRQLERERCRSVLAGTGRDGRVEPWREEQDGLVAVATPVPGWRRGRPHRVRVGFAEHESPEQRRSFWTGSLRTRRDRSWRPRSYRRPWLARMGLPDLAATTGSTRSWTSWKGWGGLSGSRLRGRPAMTCGRSALV